MCVAVGVVIGSQMRLTFITDVKLALAGWVNSKTAKSDLVKVAKHTYRLTYMFRGEPFHIMIPVKRGPRDFIHVHTEDGSDVTDEIRMFLGPGEDFHSNTAISPNDLGYSKLHFSTREGEVRSYENDAPIVLSNNRNTGAQLGTR